MLLSIQSHINNGELSDNVLYAGVNNINLIYLRGQDSRVQGFKGSSYFFPQILDPLSS